MAGELVFQPFDRARYDTLLPLLKELDAARGLSAASRALLASLFTPPPSDLAYERGKDAAARIAATPGVELRVHLGPGEIDGLSDAVVSLACLPPHDYNVLVDHVGPTWVTLDSSQRHLVHHDWWEAIFFEADPRFVERPPYPARSESRWSLLTPEGAALLVGGLDVALATLELHPLHRAEFEALRSRAARTIEGPIRLGHQFLL